MWPSNDLHDPCWFLNPHFLAFRIWFLVIIFLERYWIFIPGAIFGKNVKKIIKSHVPETAPRPKDEEKHENDANSCWFSNVTIVPFHSVHSALFASRSRGVTWTTSDLISRDWRRIQFWKCSILAFWENSLKTKLKNYKTELNSLRRGLIRSETFKNTQNGSFRFIRDNSGLFKILKILKIWKLVKSFKMIQWGWRIQVYFPWLGVPENIWI